ncbi:hypothetical protein ACKWTF_009613 [Chironomus riparius]
MPSQDDFNEYFYQFKIIEPPTHPTNSILHHHTEPKFLKSQSSYKYSKTDLNILKIPQSIPIRTQKIPQKNVINNFLHLCNCLHPGLIVNFVLALTNTKE